MRTTNPNHHLYLCDWNEGYSQNGYVSIGSGSSAPQYPLHVQQNINRFSSSATNVLFASYNYGWYGSHNLTSDHDSGRSGSISIKTEGGIWVNNGAYLATSDKRIKTNIVDLSDNLALEMLRNIPCYYYDYNFVYY